MTPPSDPLASVTHGDQNGQIASGDQDPSTDSGPISSAPRDARGRKPEDQSPEAEAKRALRREKDRARRARQAGPTLGASRTDDTFVQGVRPNPRPHPIPPASVVDPPAQVIDKTVRVVHQRVDYAATADVCVTSYFFVGSILFGRDFPPKLPEEKDQVLQLGNAFRSYFEAKGSQVDLPPEALLAVALLQFTYARVSERQSMKDRALGIWRALSGKFMPRRGSNLYGGR